MKSAVLCLWVALLLCCLPHASSMRQEGTAEAAGAGVLRLRIPKGIPESVWRKHIPADNPLTSEKVALGEELFFDRRLSASGTVSCAICHDPATAFADLQTFAIGHDGRAGARNTPTVLNAMFSDTQFWDGRAGSLEEQAREPLVNPLEMGMPSFESVVERVAGLPGYRQKFARVFGDDGVTIETITKAIAAYERTQLSGNSPFDRFITGDADAISEAQKRGWNLFRGKAGCVACHAYSPSSPFFTDFGFHNTGNASKGVGFEALAGRALQPAARGAETPRTHDPAAPPPGDLSPLGRFLVTKRPQDIGAFKTPSLRDVELTAPYMHNAAEKTLLDVVRFYNRGGGKNRHLDSRITPLGLTDAEMSDVVEFMRALTSDDVLRRVQTTRPQMR
ncbi:MAG: cytochrome c peroxidase [Pyrinomonadaceae bacterium]